MTKHGEHICLGRILYVLRDGEPHRFLDIMKETGLSKPTVSKYLKKLIKKNQVEVKAGMDFRTRNYTFLGEVDLSCPFCESPMSEEKLEQVLMGDKNENTRTT